MEGSGVYHLEANIIGTAERLAPEAIVNSHNGSSVREVLLQCACRFFSDCTFRYHGKDAVSICRRLCVFTSPFTQGCTTH